MLRFAFATLASFSIVALGCASPSSDTGSATADYSSFTLLASDTYACTLSDGHTQTTATLTRDVLQQKVAPNARLFSEQLHVGEPVFTAALASFGSYGCAHDSQGIDWSSREENFGATTLPASVDFTYDAGLQWTNCDYDGTESAAIATTTDGIAITVGMKKGSASVAFSGTCAKQN